MADDFFYYLIELTKKCNQRCSYCYERKYSADPQELSIPDIEIILKKIKDHCLKKKVKQLRLWYIGGEVMTMGAEYLSLLFMKSRQIFKEHPIHVEVGIDTNLTLLNQEHISLLKKYKVTLQVSFDIFGEQRKFANGEPINKIIIDKMILLVKNRIAFSLVAVITKQNCRKGMQIYDFCNQIQTNLHVLRMDPPPGKPSIKIAPSNKEYIKCLKDIAKRSFDEKKPINVVSFVGSYINLLKEREPLLCKFSKTCLNNHLFIENSGDVYPCCALRYYVNRDAKVHGSSNLRYDNLCLGNILKDPLDDMYNSPILAWLKTRQNNLEKECIGCKHIKHCNGGCMAIAYIEKGDIMKKSQSYCLINKEMFKFFGGKRLWLEGRK